ncbi:ABC transporter substrate-binding protein [Saccharopolyspora sp. K220]|uniref:ABC transporter substrate-binding protein n=1 Tax=Saccharopolyspora soli TaxID=2926618 RepID=UPI001F57773C|nr:ABC transporter substrate-binding protein [Saccharopolyspora soli]MCI2419788.1 ABC transporter substrate-binding protein [Saccharopolyspora soli]
MQRRRFVLGAALVTALVAAGCAANSTAGASTDTLRYAAVGAPAAASNDPHGGLGNESDAMRFALLYDVLTVPGTDGGTQPRLATSWTPDTSLTRWQVALRPDATFTDGRPVRAADVLFSLRRMQEKAAENYGRMAMFDLGSSAVVDDHTLALVTHKPFAEVGRALESATFVVPEGSIDFSNPVAGSGPFRMTGGDAANAVLERNDHWWGPRPPLRRIEIRAIADPQARANAVAAGQADVAGSVHPATTRQSEQDGLQVVHRPAVTVYPVVMRLDRAPFDDPRVREAIKLAVDRKQLVDTVFLGQGTVGNDLLTPADPTSPMLPQRQRDLGRARQLLTAAGHPDGLDLTLRTTTAYPGMDTTATLLADQLKTVGIRIQVRVEPQDTFWTQVYSQADFYVSYLGGIPFLDVARVALLSNSPTNETAWHRPDWDLGFDAALATLDEAGRNARLRGLQQQVRDEGGYLVWGVGDGLDLARPQVAGLPTGPGFQRLFIDQVRVNAT